MKWAAGCFGITFGIALVIAVLYALFPHSTVLSTEDIFLAEYPLTVWIADSASEQRAGLSGKSESDLTEARVDGMLFVYQKEMIQSFWMHKMLFDLDFVWIANGEVVKINEAIPAPHNNDGEIARLSSDPFPIDAVLELPAGSVADLGIEIGDILTR